MDRAYWRKVLCSVAALGLLWATAAPRLNGAPRQQDMQGMPGMDMGKSKPKPRPTPQKKKRTEPKKNEAEEMPGMDMSKPMPTPSPAPAASPEKMDMPGMKMETGAKPQPSTSPLKANEKMDMDGAAPTGPAQPAASPAQSGAPMNAPATPDATGPGQTIKPRNEGGQDGHDMGNMTMGGAGTGESKSGEMKDSMPGMKMKGTGRMDPDSLMVMAGEEMNIRVGRSSGNSFAMGQMGSGTSWQPSTTPMYMWYKATGKWLLFFHGDMKMGVNSEGGPRGVTKFESQNWFMPMAFRRVGPGTLQLRGMFSFEPFTFSGKGSPQLFQTGESYRGLPLRDAQHPHDLFMELSATYTVPVGERGTWFAYLGFPGEPALGPTAFMHRWSASENPSAPLAHHLQDSTHISFGVLTTGFTYRWFKLEASVFNGREPDEYKPWTRLRSQAPAPF